MPHNPRLRVLPRGTGMVQNYETMGVVRQYHGWSHDSTLGEHEPILDDKTGKPTGKTRPQGGFVKLEASLPEHVIELPWTTEYVRALRDGSLWPADQATAQAVGVPFDPEFGGEHPLGKPSEKPADQATAQAESSEEHK